MPLIKRYPNRKLYDTQASRYITLADVAKLVRSGEDVQVVDNVSGVDLTEATLAQVISVQARQAPRSLPLQALSRLIGSLDAPDREWVGRVASAVDELERDGDLAPAGAEWLRRLLEEAQTTPDRRAIERRVSKALDQLGLPRKAELEELHSHLDVLYERLNALSR